MSESVEVRPRYREQPEQIMDPAPPPPMVASSTSGLFTSMYDNKVIVIFIIVAIILLGITAYVVFRKPEIDKEDLKPPQPPLAPKQVIGSGSQPQPQPQPQQQQPQLQSASESKPQLPTEPGPQTNKDKLMMQLAKSKGIDSAANNNGLPNIPDSHRLSNLHNTPDGSKSENEIMHLMEDEPNYPAANNDTATAVIATAMTETAADQTKSISELILPADDDIPIKPDESAVAAAPVQTQGGMCTAVVPPGRSCRNKARSNDKCQRHGG